MGKSQVGEVNCSLGFWINNVLEVSANLGKKCEIMVAQSLSMILWHFFNKKHILGIYYFVNYENQQKSYISFGVLVQNHRTH